MKRTGPGIDRKDWFLDFLMLWASETVELELIVLSVHQSESDDDERPVRSAERQLVSAETCRAAAEQQW